jgi:hypothetical protein
LSALLGHSMCTAAASLAVGVLLCLLAETPAMQQMSGEPGALPLNGDQQQHRMAYQRVPVLQ